MLWTYVLYHKGKSSTPSEHGEFEAADANEAADKAKAEGQSHAMKEIANILRNAVMKET